MVVVLKPDTKEEQIENLKVWLSSMGISTHISRGVNHTIVGLVGDTSVVDMDLVRALDIVENVQRIQEPFKNANRKFHNADQVVDIAGVKIGGGSFAVSDAYNTYPLAVKLHIADLTATYLLEQGSSEVENGHEKKK